MKKILFLIILFLPLYASAWNVDFSSNEKKYCEWITTLDNYKEKLSSTASRIHGKFPYSSPTIRSQMIQTEENMWKNSINELLWILNNMITKNSNLYWLDCYQLDNSNKNQLKSVKITKVWPKKLFNNSKITINWSWFWSKFTSDISLYLWYWWYQYEITKYYKYSDKELILPIPNDVTWIINTFENYHFKLCKNDKCIYSNIVDSSITNDTYSHMQFYLDSHNIIKARDYIKNSKKVKIAIIDDWISLNHPDLTNNIWVNSKEIPWNWIDDDANWYIDDYNSWNFVYNKNNTKPLWTHWTKIAWIIWAQINNIEWIWWILNNVELMSVWVCDEKWCNTDNVIKWIKYAVDNWANIINLSLWWHQFNWYNQSYDDALKYAYEKNVIVVIAWGNWDVLSNKINWINTKINNISPVCNYWNNYKNVIWVWAYKTNWSNFWDCIDFYAMWESIFSTSFWENNSLYWKNYALSDWTSFSAPIITWIIWLGYEKFWKIDRFIIYDSLKESINNWVIDSKRYLEILENKISKTETTKTIETEDNTLKTINNNSLDDKLKIKIDKLFIKLEKKFNKESSDTQIVIYTKLNNKIDKLVEWNLNEDTKLILKYLKELIIKKINSIDVWDILNDFIN